jgi:hypothetical protein
MRIGTLGRAAEQMYTASGNNYFPDLGSHAAKQD